MRLIDTHCHLQFNAYRDDADEVAQKTAQAGVGMLVVGSQSTTSQNAVKLAQKHDLVWAAVGLHPNHLCEQEFEDTQEIIKTRCENFDPVFYEELARQPKVVAIGEFGLDYYRLPKNLDHNEIIAKQRETARAHLDLADRLNLPVIIHCRAAHSEQAELLAEYIKDGKLERRGVIHCYTGTLEEAKKYLDLGFYISFTGILTFASDVQAVAREIPLDRIMVETDAPYLTPEPHRGQRNEPMYVEFIAKKLAEIKNLPEEEVFEKTTKNAMMLFGLPPSLLLTTPPFPSSNEEGKAHASPSS